GRRLRPGGGRAFRAGARRARAPADRRRDRRCRGPLVRRAQRLLGPAAVGRGGGRRRGRLPGGEPARAGAPADRRGDLGRGRHVVREQPSTARSARTTWGGRTGADARGDRGRGRRVSGGQPAPGGSAGPGRADVPDGPNLGAGRGRVRRDRAGLRHEPPAHHSPVRDPAAHDGHGAAHHRRRGPMTEDGAKAQRDAALRALHGEPDIQPMLQMDGVRIATLAVLAVNTLAVIVLATFLITNARHQRLVNECYQTQVDALVSWAVAASEAARNDRQAQRELLLAQPRTPEEGRAALDRYLAKLDEADRTSTTAPVPSQRCTR